MPLGTFQNAQSNCPTFYLDGFCNNAFTSNEEKVVGCQMEKVEGKLEVRSIRDIGLGRDWDLENYGFYGRGEYDGRLPTAAGSRNRPLPTLKR